SRQEQSGENRDDGDDNQELDQGKSNGSSGRQPDCRDHEGPEYCNRKLPSTARKTGARQNSSGKPKHLSCASSLPSNGFSGRQTAGFQQGQRKRRARPGLRSRSSGALTRRRYRLGEDSIGV